MTEIKYTWPSFNLVYNRETGRTTTFYPNGRWSGCDPVPEDKFHGEKLGITNKLHRLQHELAHHLVGIHYYGADSSPIIHRDANGIPQTQPHSELEEWMVTALQYYSRNRWSDFGAMMDLSKKTDVDKLAKQLAYLMDAAEQKHVALISMVNK
jgi:hypothetical protein